jgi:hypothetical protein
MRIIRTSSRTVLLFSALSLFACAMPATDPMLVPGAIKNVVERMETGALSGKKVRLHLLGVVDTKAFRKLYGEKKGLVIGGGLEYLRAFGGSRDSDQAVIPYIETQTLSELETPGISARVLHVELLKAQIEKKLRQSGAILAGPDDKPDVSFYVLTRALDLDGTFFFALLYNSVGSKARVQLCGYAVKEPSGTEFVLPEFEIGAEITLKSHYLLFFGPCWTTRSLDTKPGAEADEP